MKLLQTRPLRLARATLGACLLANTWLIPAAAVAQSLEIIDLQYRTAQEVIPVLQPLLETGGALSGTDYKLFVRASAANVAQLRKALAQIDRQPRQLRVSVRRASRQEMQREAAGASGVIGTDQSRVTVHATDASAQRQNAAIASVQVLEGNSAYIATAQSVPMVTAVVAGGRKPWVASATSYRDVNSGFLVTPRISADRVTLDISQQAQHSSHSGGVDTQQLSTQVSAGLGEWMQLGGISESSNSQGSGILNRQYSTQSDELGIWVKVEER